MFIRRALWLLPWSLPWLWIPGCAPAPETAAPLAVKSVFPDDDLGREIALRSPAKRVIVIGPGAIETLFALGAGKSLVGRDSYADFPPEAKKVAIAGDYSGPSVEKCVALRPDLVILQGETWDKARVEGWQKQIGAPVAALVATDVKGVAVGIGKFGKWLGQSAGAGRVTAALQPSRNSSNRRTFDGFIEIGRSPLWTAGQKTLVSSVLSQGGGKNMAQVSGYQPYGLESLLARQPEFYLVPSKAKRETVLEQLRGHAALSKLNCVRRGQVIVVDPDLVLRPGPRLGLGIAKIKQEAMRLSGN